MELIKGESLTIEKYFDVKPGAIPSPDDIYEGFEDIGGI